MIDKQLVDEIKTTAWREVKLIPGRTNGQPVLHIRDLEGRSSRTIKNRGEWFTHPLHPRNRPPRKRDEGEAEQ